MQLRHLNLASHVILITAIILLISVGNILEFHYEVVGLIGLLLFIILSITDLRYGIYVWIALSGIFTVPLIQVRQGEVYLGYVLLSILLVIWLLKSITSGGDSKKTISPNNVTIPGLIFCLLVISATFFGTLYRDEGIVSIHDFNIMKIYAGSLYVLSIASLFMITNNMISYKDIKFIYIILMAVSFIIIFDRGFINLNIIPGGDIFLIYTSPLAISMAVHGKRHLGKLFLLVIPFFAWQRVVVEFLHPDETQWMYRWVSVILSTLCVFYFKSQKMFFSILAVFLVVGLISSENLKETGNQIKEEGVDVRFIEWESALKLFVYWPLGIGPGNYFDYSSTYRDKGLMSLSSAHGQYIQIIAETGVATLIVFFLFGYRVLKTGLLLYRNLSDEFLKAFVAGAMAAVFSQFLAAGLGDHIFPAYHNGGAWRFCTSVYTWIYAGAILAIGTFSCPESHRASRLRQNDIPCISQ